MQCVVDLMIGDVITEMLSFPLRNTKNRKSESVHDMAV